jgi:hypothetical protein
LGLNSLLQGWTVVRKIPWGLVALLWLCAIPGAAALAAQGYQSDIGPTPLDGANRVNVLGRGFVLATLDGQTFKLHGTFAGLATPATQAHLCMGSVMGGTGPVIHELTVTAAQKGEISGSVTLSQEQVAALKRGRIYLLLDSQKAPKGNLWGWFQPAHKTVGADVPQQGNWYIPNILLEDMGTDKKKPQG